MGEVPGKKIDVQPTNIPEELPRKEELPTLEDLQSRRLIDGREGNGYVRGIPSRIPNDAIIEEGGIQFDPKDNSSYWYACYKHPGEVWLGTTGDFHCRCEDKKEKKNEE